MHTQVQEIPEKGNLILHILKTHASVFQTRIKPFFLEIMET